VKTILAKAFHVDGLHAPASVVHDEEQDVYFVANAGFVSRVTPAGKIEDAKFIDGLSSPEGMAILDTQLWIADGHEVRVFDRVSGASVRTIDLAPRGAVTLRGIAVGGDDAVYVTDSAAVGRIFRISGELVEIALAGDELRGPNAIAWDGLRFLVAPAYGQDVVAWSPGGGTKAVMRGPGAYDGIVVLPNGAVIVSSEYDDALHVGYGSGDLRPLFTRKPTPTGIGFDRKRNRLLVPSREGNWLEAWTLPPMEAPRSTSRGKTPEMAMIVLK
jgi:sugar lactone lactonase YvrE